jgi:NAD(P)-dependent dehydrogenase (short-subunit alcohol dehydrogenase family)
MVDAFMRLTYVVTGANRGIGLQMAKRVLTLGHQLVAICRQPDTAHELSALVQESNGFATLFAADVCDAQALADIAHGLDHSVDVLVCNAGVMSARGGISDPGNDAASISTALMTNVASPFFTARAFLGALNRSSAPRIAIISSLMGSQQHQGTSAYFYRASKAGANNIMVSLANELQPQGIAVASFHPGWVRTDMGGDHADISPEESAHGLVQQFDSMSLAQTGGFFNYDGKPLPM